MLELKECVCVRTPVSQFGEGQLQSISYSRFQTLDWAPGTILAAVVDAIPVVSQSGALDRIRNTAPNEGAAREGVNLYHSTWAGEERRSRSNTFHIAFTN